MKVERIATEIHHLAIFISGSTLILSSLRLSFDEFIDKAVGHGVFRALNRDWVKFLSVVGILGLVEVRDNSFVTLFYDGCFVEGDSLSLGP